MPVSTHVLVKNDHGGIGVDEYFLLCPPWAMSDYPIAYAMDMSAGCLPNHFVVIKAISSYLPTYLTLATLMFKFPSEGPTHKVFYLIYDTLALVLENSWKVDQCDTEEADFLGTEGTQRLID